MDSLTLPSKRIVWVVVDRDRDYAVASVTVYDNKPNWECDFYETFHKCEIQPIPKTAIRSKP